jgi:hypothetical protein
MYDLVADRPATGVEAWQRLCADGYGEVRRPDAEHIEGHEAERERALPGLR